mgnify:CR=1 FL=1
MIEKKFVPLQPKFQNIIFIKKQMKKTLFSVVVLAIALVMGTMMSCSKEEEVPAMSVEELNAQIENLTDSNVVVEGVVAHICQHSGMKMKMEGADFHFVWDSVFDASLMGQKVRIEGIVREQRLTADEINAMEAELIAKMQEDSINGVEHKCEGKCEGKCHGEQPAAEAQPAETEAQPAEEGEHQCSGEHHEEEEMCPMMRIQKMKEELAANVENGMDYIVVARYIEVTKVTPVVEEAK